MNEIALQMNDILKTTVVGDLLSDFGRRMYFPKGIVAQSAEAKVHATKYNATAGVAMSHGQPMHLSDISAMMESSGCTAQDIFNYAPAGGELRLRELWQQAMVKKNPLLKDVSISLPIVTGGLTHGISIAMQMFVQPGQTVVIPDLFWDNYDLIIRELCQGEIRTFPLYDDKLQFNVQGMKQALRSCGDSARLLLNFPNNPTGYTPTGQQMLGIRDALVELAEESMKLAVISDDAYFGLFYEPQTCTQSLFSYLADAHENLLAIKGDAATKEDMVWGFRVGFLTYGGKGLNPAHFEALLNKTLGAIRCTVSSCDKPGQTMLIHAMTEGKRYEEDKQAAKQEMQERYRIVAAALARHTDSSLLKPYPFNSGYFMAFACAGDAEQLRRYLLDAYQIGTVNIMGRTLRMAYCSVEKEQLHDLVDTIYKAAEELWK